MRFNHPVYFILFSAIVGMSGCGSNPNKKLVEEDPLPPIVRKIALIQALEPVEFEADNRGSVLDYFGLMGWVIKKDIEGRGTRAIDSALDERTFRPGKEISEALLHALEKKGYEIEYVANPPRNPKDPEEIDWNALRTDADALILLEIDEIGLFSGFTTTRYIPRLNVDLDMVSRDREHDYFDFSIAYGADAETRNDEEIPAPWKYRFGSLEEAARQHEVLIDGFRYGIKRMADSFAFQVDRQKVSKEAKRIQAEVQAKRAQLSPAGQ